jgi:hypothetical protein
METMVDQTQLLLNAVPNDNELDQEDEEEEKEDLSVQLKQCKDDIDNMYHSGIPIKDQEISIKSVVMIIILKKKINIKMFICMQLTSYLGYEYSKHLSKMLIIIFKITNIK